jgi:hypothetical protein
MFIKSQNLRVGQCLQILALLSTWGLNCPLARSSSSENPGTSSVAHATMISAIECFPCQTFIIYRVSISFTSSTLSYPESYEWTGTETKGLEHLPSQCEALSSNTSTTKKKKVINLRYFCYTFSSKHCISYTPKFLCLFSFSFI